MPDRSSWLRTGSCSTCSPSGPSWVTSSSTSPSSPSLCGTWTPSWPGGWSWCGSGSCTWVSARRTWSGGPGPLHLLWSKWRCFTTRSTACPPHTPCRAPPSPSPCSSWPTAAGRYVNAPQLSVINVLISDFQQEQRRRSWHKLLPFPEEEAEKVPVSHQRVFIYWETLEIGENPKKTASRELHMLLTLDLQTGAVQLQTDITTKRQQSDICHDIITAEYIVKYATNWCITVFYCSLYEVINFLSISKERRKEFASWMIQSESNLKGSHESFISQTPPHMLNFIFSCRWTQKCWVADLITGN